MSIRRLCARVVVLAAALSIALGAAACSSGSSNGPATGAGRVDPNGILRIGEALTTTLKAPNFDPIKGSNGAAAAAYLLYVYGTLLRQNADGSYTPELAERATVVNSSTITVQLRPNLKFQDGTPLNAEAVKFTILRNKAANPASMRTSLLDPVSSIDVTSATNLTIHLSSPIAGAWYNLLAYQETDPVSPTAVKDGVDLSTHPVGAGPFKLTSISDSEIKLVKWDGYFDADKVQLAGIDIVNVDSPEAQVNALRTGAIDADPISFAEVAQLQGSSVTTKVTIPANPSWDWMILACNKQPKLLGDVRVRQALIDATNRAAIANVLYPGYAQAQTQWVPKSSPLYDTAFANLYPYSVSKAKALLAAAGESHLQLTLAEAAGASSIEQTRIAELLQAQWAEAGIDLKVVTTSNVVQEFFIDGNLDMVDASGGGAPSLIDLFGTYFTNEIGGTCAPNSPEFSKDMAQFEAATPGSAAYAAALHAITAFLLDQARFVPLEAAPSAYAYGSDVGKMTLRPTSQGYAIPDYIGTYVSS